MHERITGTSVPSGHAYQRSGSRFWLQSTFSIGDQSVIDPAHSTATWLGLRPELEEERCTSRRPFAMFTNDAGQSTPANVNHQVGDRGAIAAGDDTLADDRYTVLGSLHVTILRQGCDDHLDPLGATHRPTLRARPRRHGGITADGSSPSRQRLPIRTRPVPSRVLDVDLIDRARGCACRTPPWSDGFVCSSCIRISTAARTSCRRLHPRAVRSNRTVRPEQRVRYSILVCPVCARTSPRPASDERSRREHDRSRPRT